MRWANPSASNAARPGPACFGGAQPIMASANAAHVSRRMSEQLDGLEQLGNEV